MLPLPNTTNFSYPMKPTGTNLPEITTKVGMSLQEAMQNNEIATPRYTI